MHLKFDIFTTPYYIMYSLNCDTSRSNYLKQSWATLQQNILSINGMGFRVQRSCHSAYVLIAFLAVLMGVCFRCPESKDEPNFWNSNQIGWWILPIYIKDGFPYLRQIGFIPFINNYDCFARYSANKTKNVFGISLFQQQ